MDNNGLKCATDHILEAQQKGEINEDNVLYIIENINVAGMHVQSFSSSSLFMYLCQRLRPAAVGIFVCHVLTLCHRVTSGLGV
jgi:hypothetical protein